MKKQLRSHSLVIKLVTLMAVAGLAAMAQDTVAPPPPPMNEVIKPHREPIRQLGRGLSNVLTGVWEIPLNMYNVMQDSGDVAGATYGTVRGVCRFVTREVVGVFEIVTFPFGWGPVVEPEFTFEPGRSTDWRINRKIGFSED